MWVWCQRCERCYEWEEYRHVAGVECCPYAGCGAPTGRYACCWSHLREAHPEYPERPARGVRYPAWHIPVRTAVRRTMPGKRLQRAEDGQGRGRRLPQMN